MGEKEPYENYTITHGLCEKCEKEDGLLDKNRLKKIHLVIDYFRKLKKEVSVTSTVKVEAIIKEGLEIGIKPEDIAIGMVQPLLYEIGEMWAAGRASIAQEHKVTAHCSELIDVLLSKSAKAGSLRNSLKPKVLLVLADGNYHTLGLRIIEIFLVAKNIPSYVVIPGLPAGEVEKLVIELKPEIVGVSVSLVPQLESVRELARNLKNLPARSRPRIIIGGQAVRMGLTVRPDWGIEVMTDFRCIWR
ncbi:MAG: cobalamin B12-binding domain-containing protein [Candidatus Firestonebacteria bacterium]